MPKLVVAIISVAFALVIGFTCGAMLTSPTNSRMESLVNENKVFKENIIKLENEALSLRNDVNSLNETNQELKNQLLKIYKEKNRTP